MTNTYCSYNNIIHAESATAFVAISIEDAKIHVGFAYKSGNSPTNVFEELAALVWRKYFPSRPFSDFSFYDFQRLGLRDEDGKHIFSIFPIKLNGYACRKRLFGLVPDKQVLTKPRTNDVLKVKTPIWKKEIMLDDLPHNFRLEVKKNLIDPSRAEGLI